MLMPTQQGFAIIASAITLLFIMTVIGFISAKTIITEQQVVNNDYLEKESFTAAEAGQEIGPIHLNNRRWLILKDSNGDGLINAYSHSDITDVQQANGTRYSVTYTNPTLNHFGMIEVNAIGSSRDGEVSRSIKELYMNLSFLAASPPYALITHQSVSLGGNLTISNTHDGKTIWSGSDISFSGSASTDAGGGNGSDKNFYGPDLMMNDANISAMTGDDFFHAMIGKDKSAAKASVDIFLSNASSTNYSAMLDGVVGQSIWIEQTSGTARINSNTTIGSIEQPVILFVDGDLKLNGSLEVYGVIYVANDFHNSGGGNLEIHGSLLVEGEFSGTGTPNVIYDPNVLGNLQQRVGILVKVPGSWHDI